MKTFAFATALALVSAAPAFANAQLARSLGLEPGVYTIAELSAIKGATEERATDNRDFVASLVARTGGGVVSTQSVGASNQLAANLGLDAGDFTAAQLATIKGVTEERATDNRDFLASLVSRTGGGVVSTQSVGASSQLAANLGLDGRDFTAAQLATIKGVIEERATDNRFFVNDLIVR
jgi:hypothetical protein